MAETILPKLDPTTGRLAPGGAPRHDDLHGLAAHVPTATGKATGLMPRTNGDGTWGLVPTPTVDPYTSAGATLGMTHVKPATQTDYTPNNQTGEYHATLAVTFEVPTSGKVTIEVNAVFLNSDTLRLQEGSTVLAEVDVTASSGGDRRHIVTVLTGLTPGSTHTATLAGGGTLNVRVSPTKPATIVAKDAPF